MAVKKTNAKTATRSSRKKTADDYKSDQPVNLDVPSGFKQADSGDLYNFAKIGDRITGKYVGQEEITTKKGKSQILLVENNGVTTRAFMSTHLKKIFKANKNIKVGMTILVVLKDVREIGSRQTYKVFEVFYK